MLTSSDFFDSHSQNNSIVDMHILFLSKEIIIKGHKTLIHIGNKCPNYWPWKKIQATISLFMPQKLKIVFTFLNGWKKMMLHGMWKLHKIQILLFINKILLKNMHIDLFMCCLWLILCYNGRLLSSVLYLSYVWLFVIPWTAARQASLSITNSQTLLKLSPLSWWCHPTISSSVIPFSSCLQSFPASGSFQMS